VIGELVVALLCAAAVAYVAGPLRGRAPTGSLDGAGPERELEARKRSALAAILDLEGERALGKLSAEDFGALVATYEAEAVDALRRLDELRAAAGDGIEEEVAAARARLRCPSCGAPREGSGRGAPTCPRCGA
jgi:hypothetical protein